MNRYSTLKIFDYSIFTSNLNQIDLESKCVINTLNQYSYVIAEKDEIFKKSLKESDVLLPDGIGIVAATKFLKGKTIKKIAGADLHLQLLKNLNKNNGSCFYLGSSEQTLMGIKERINMEFSCIKVGTFSPPFKAQFTSDDNAHMVSCVNSFNPDVLFVGMTAPKQEKWVYQHHGALDAKVICSIGAVFDFYGGDVNRPHRIWIKLGLEWLVRLVHEPKRMWKRYLFYGPVFLYLVLKEKVFLMLKIKKRSI